MSVNQIRYQFALKNEKETGVLASQLANISETGDVIGLSGNLGVGKTAFARAFINARGGSVEVLSPTFTLVQVYNFSDVNVYHFDL